HADIYTDLAHYESAFDQFCATVPADGWLGVSASYPRAVEMARVTSTARLVTYSGSGAADYRADGVTLSSVGARFMVESTEGSTGEFLPPHAAGQNAYNAH